MSILSLSTISKIIAVKNAEIWLIKKITTRAHYIQIICLALFFSIFSIESQAKATFDVIIKSHNSEQNTNSGVIVIEGATGKNVYDTPVSNAYKQETSTSSTTEKRAIVYANGMFTSPTEAANNLNTVRRSFQYTASTSEFRLAYNFSEDVLNQVAEVAAQHIKQQGNLTDKQAWFQMAYKLLLPKVYNLLEDAETAIASINEASYVNDVDLNSHINQHYLPLLNDDYKVVILSHSQGNFYANRAWNTIANMANGSELTNALGIVGVADVASYVAGNGLHTTNSNDFIVNAVRLLSGPQPLAANVTHPITSKEPLGHGLSEIYLNDDLDAKHIKAKIQADVNTTFDRLEIVASCDDFYRETPNGGSGSGLNTSHAPGENYKGYLDYSLNAYDSSARNQLRVVGNSGLLLDTGIVTGVQEGRFYYDGPKDGTLSVVIYNSDQKSFDEWTIGITCPK